MGLAAKRFLQVALRQRLEHRDPVIPMKAVVIENEGRRNSGALLPMNIKSIRISHESIAMPPPILKIVIEQYQTHGIQGMINGPEKLRNGCPKPTFANPRFTKKAFRDEGVDKDSINGKYATEPETDTVLSSPILLQTHDSERSHSATDQASGDKRNATPPNRKHETTLVTIPRGDTSTTKTKNSRSKAKHDSLVSTPSNLDKDSTISKELKTHSNEGKKRSSSNRRVIQNAHVPKQLQASASSKLQKGSIPKKLQTYCNEGNYWAIEGKKRSSSNRRVIQNAHVPKQLQNHCAEGKYWEIDHSSNKRKRSPSVKLMESSQRNKTKKKKQRRTAPSRRWEHRSNETTKWYLLTKYQTVMPKLFWLLEYLSRKDHASHPRLPDSYHVSTQIRSKKISQSKPTFCHCCYANPKWLYLEAIGVVIMVLLVWIIHFEIRQPRCRNSR